MNFFEEIWGCLNESSISSKTIKLHAIEANLDKNSNDGLTKPKSLQTPSYASFFKVY